MAHSYRDALRCRQVNNDSQMFICPNWSHRAPEIPGVIGYRYSLERNRWDAFVYYPPCSPLEKWIALATFIELVRDGTVDTDTIYCGE